MISKKMILVFLN